MPTLPSFENKIVFLLGYNLLGSATILRGSFIEGSLMPYFVTSLTRTNGIPSSHYESLPGSIDFLIITIPSLPPSN